MRLQFTFFGPAVVCCALTPRVCASDEFGPDPVFSTTLRGDFVAIQDATRVLAGSQVDDFPVAIAWPGMLVRAYANWTYLTDTPGDSDEAQITLNGTPIIGALTANTSFDTDWGFSHVASYSANITSFLATNGAGTYIVGSAVDEPSTFALGEGITFLLVYDNGSPLRHIHVYLGGINSSAFSLGTGFGYMELTPAYQSGAVHFFVNAIDGQDTLFEEFHVNGVSLGGVLTGGSLLNAFVGAEGPSGNPGDVRYDRAEGDVSSWVSTGSTLVIFDSVGPFTNHDAVGHTIGAVSYAAECFGDLNRDNSVDVGDLAVMLAHFGMTPSTYATGDLTNDDLTAIDDLTTFLSDFGVSCP